MDRLARETIVIGRCFGRAAMEPWRERERERERGGGFFFFFFFFFLTRQVGERNPGLQRTRAGRRSLKAKVNRNSRLMGRTARAGCVEPAGRRNRRVDPPGGQPERPQRHDHRGHGRERRRGQEGHLEAESREQGQAERRPDQLAMPGIRL